jgi:hypothetical protein
MGSKTRSKQCGRGVECLGGLPPTRPRRFGQLLEIYVYENAASFDTYLA